MLSFSAWLCTLLCSSWPDPDTAPTHIGSSYWSRASYKPEKGVSRTCLATQVPALSTSRSPYVSINQCIAYLPRMTAQVRSDQRRSISQAGVGTSEPLGKPPTADTPLSPEALQGGMETSRFAWRHQKHRPLIASEHSPKLWCGEELFSRHCQSHINDVHDLRPRAKSRCQGEAHC